LTFTRQGDRISKLIIALETIMVKTKTHEIKPLNPRDADSKYFGPEPEFNSGNTNKLNLGEALTWYHHFYDKKDAKEFIAQYLDFTGKTTEAKALRRVSDSKVSTTYGFVARCVLRGYNDENTINKLSSEIGRLLTGEKEEPEVEEVTTSVVIKPNIQERMREKALEAGGELEGQWDEYILGGCKKESNINPVSVLTQHNVLPQHINILTSSWQRKLDEYTELQAGKDEQLNEAYSHMGKVQIRNIIGVIEKVISDLNSYVNLKKAGRKPRAKKPVPVEKIVRSLKYLKTYKLDKLELVSVPPTKLHGCAEAWVYDTKKRKLHHYVADDYAKSLSVKGNSVIGFCTKNSEVKTLRKPETQIKEVMGSKPAARKYFKDIKTVSVSPNGRFNADMIILKAF
jgi:hypothetical protein